MKAAAAILILAIISPVALADVGGAVSVTTDYIYRGLDYWDDAEAVNLLLEYQAGTGLYLGAWASRQKNARRSFRGSRELDYFLGYATVLSDSILFDLSYSHNTFPDARVIDYDWQELALAFHVGRQWTLLWGKNRNQFTQQQNGQVLEVTHRRLVDAPGLNNLLLDISLGRVVNAALPNSYDYYEIGFSRGFGRFQPRLSWITTSEDKNDNSFPRLAKNQWQLTLNYLF